MKRYIAAASSVKQKYAKYSIDELWSVLDVANYFKTARQKGVPFEDAYEWVYNKSIANPKSGNYRRKSFEDSLNTLVDMFDSYSDIAQAARIIDKFRDRYLDNPDEEIYRMALSDEGRQEAWEIFLSE